MNRDRIFGIAAISTAILMTIIFSVGYYIFNLRVNFTKSAPVGLWRVQPVSTLARGELVEVCPPVTLVVAIMVSKGYLDSGDCPGGVVSLLKPIAAIPGDTVIIRHGNLAKVNGSVLPLTLSMPSIPRWPDGIYKVNEGSVWLLSTYSMESFDSRYFGPVPLANVRGRATPLLVKGNPADMTKVVYP